MNKLSILFEEPPIQWGLRGDPLLWSEMKLELETIDFPANIEDLQKLLHSIFNKLTGENLVQGKRIFVRKYADNSAGMSRGQISSNFWTEKGFPLILQRYKENMKNRDNK